MLEPRIVLPFAISFFAIAGLMSGNAGLLFIAGAIFFLLVFAWVLGNESSHKISAERSGHVRAFEQEKVDIHLKLTNRGSVPLTGLQLTDRFHAQDMLPKKILVQTDLAPHRKMEIIYHPYCLRHRGQYPVGPLEVFFFDPLGFFPRKRSFPTPDYFTVLPRPLPMNQVGLDGRRTLLSASTPDQQTRGESLKFYGTREYRTGDPLRFVHWKASARTGELVVKQFESSVSSQITIFLDLELENLAGLGSESTVEYGIRAAASIAAASVSEDHEIQLYGEGESPLIVPLGRGEGHLSSLLEELALTKPKGKRPLPELITRYIDAVPQGSQIFLIIAGLTSDIPEYAKALGLLRGRYTRVSAIIMDNRSFIQHKQWKKDLDNERWPPLVRLLVNMGAKVKLIRQGADIAAHLKETEK